MPPPKPEQVNRKAQPSRARQAAAAANSPLGSLSAASLRSPKASAGKKPTPTPSPSPSPSKRFQPHPKSVRPKLLTMSAIAIFAFSTYGTYLYVTYTKSIEASKSLQVPVDVSDRYQKTAPTYDMEVDMAEKMMRLGTKRKDLVRMARGNVLEVSCGTGRNMEYYQFGERRGVDKDGKAEIQGCRSVTFVDQSGEMVKIAREKFEKMFPGFRKVVAFRTQDAMEPVTPAFSSSSDDDDSGKEAHKFDTIIQTMGLCSHPDPTSFLTHLGTITEPERGRILLLEHGRSYYGWMNRLLDDLAPAHADRHGCWWNRDIGEIVDKSGLEVIDSKRWHLGTTWLYILRPRNGIASSSSLKQGGSEKENGEKAEKDSETYTPNAAAATTGWLSWIKS